MLLYVWRAFHMKGRWDADVEDAPSLDALLAEILSSQVRQRLRIGLGRDYRQDATEVYGIRGRVDFDECVRRMTLPHGRAFCRFETFDVNVPKNRIIRSTLALLVQVGNFGVDHGQAERLRGKLRRLIREMGGVDIIELEANSIRQEQLRRHDPDYSLILSICYLLLQRRMPCETPGYFRLPYLDRDFLTLHDVYEKFVAEFYRVHLVDWHVQPQTIIKWPTGIDSSYLPVMKPDLLLQHRASGELIVLDTKFTKSSLVTGHWGNLTFDSGHLFQMYAYLKSQEGRSPRHGTATGILLYPTAEHDLSECVEIQNHEIRWETIDLGSSWENIEEALLAIPTAVLKAGM